MWPTHRLFLKVSFTSTHVDATNSNETWSKYGIKFWVSGDLVLGRAPKKTKILRTLLLTLHQDALAA